MRCPLRLRPRSSTRGTRQVMCRYSSVIPSSTRSSPAPGEVGPCLDLGALAEVDVEGLVQKAGGFAPLVTVGDPESFEALFGFAELVDEVDPFVGSPGWGLTSRLRGLSCCSAPALCPSRSGPLRCARLGGWRGPPLGHRRRQVPWGQGISGRRLCCTRPVRGENPRGLGRRHNRDHTKIRSLGERTIAILKCQPPLRQLPLQYPCITTVVRVVVTFDSPSDQEGNGSISRNLPVFTFHAPLGVIGNCFPVTAVDLG